MAFCFDTLCHLAYMIYITNANTRINILSITAGCREYMAICCSHFTGDCYNAANPRVGWGGVEYGQLIHRKIIKNVAT